MSTSKANEILAQVTIPARPEVLMQVTQAMKQEEPDFGLIAQLITKDISLSAGILQVVNSPLLGLQTKISSIQQAISMLGLKKTVMLVRSISVRNVCKNAAKLSEFWDRANDIAFICKEIADRIEFAERDEVFSLGLFHACGIPILMEHFSDYPQFYANATTEPKSLELLEKERYGVDHTQISGLLCRQWFLSADIIIAVENRHRPFELLCKKFPEHQSKLTMIAILKTAIGLNYEINKLYRTDVSVEQAWATESSEVIDFLALVKPIFFVFMMS